MTIISNTNFELAQTRITNDMTVGELRKVRAAQAKLKKQFEKAALAYILAEEGRDLKAEEVHWMSLSFKVSAGRAGYVEVFQAADDDNAFKNVGHWRISKARLLTRYMNRPV